MLAPAVDSGPLRLQRSTEGRIQRQALMAEQTKALNFRGTFFTGLSPATECRKFIIYYCLENFLLMAHNKWQEPTFQLLWIHLVCEHDRSIYWLNNLLLPLI